eukprot:10901520-Heterocapsa_arctica.AAC.1
MCYGKKSNTNKNVQKQLEARGTQMGEDREGTTEFLRGEPTSQRNNESAIANSALSLLID